MDLSITLCAKRRQTGGGGGGGGGVPVAPGCDLSHLPKVPLGLSSAEWRDVVSSGRGDKGAGRGVRRLEDAGLVCFKKHVRRD